MPVVENILLNYAKKNKKKRKYITSHATGEPGYQKSITMPLLSGANMAILM
jgi:hypothetical protein